MLTWDKNLVPLDKTVPIFTLLLNPVFLALNRSQSLNTKIIQNKQTYNDQQSLNDTMYYKATKHSCVLHVYIVRMEFLWFMLKQTFPFREYWPPRGKSLICINGIRSAISLSSS